MQVIEEQIQTHAGNKESTYYRSDKPEARREYRELKIKLKELKEEERIQGEQQGNGRIAPQRGVRLVFIANWYDVIPRGVKLIRQRI